MSQIHFECVPNWEDDWDTNSTDSSSSTTLATISINSVDSPNPKHNYNEILLLNSPVITGMISSPAHYEILVAMAPDSNKEDSEWYIFLRNGTDCEEHRVIGKSEEKVFAAENLIMIMRGYFTTSLMKPQLDHPNASWVGYFGRLYEGGLIASEVVAGLKMQATYSSEEFKGEGEFFSEIDIGHPDTLGENELRAVEWRNDFVSGLQGL
ncbi:uncharacterized protein BDV14DRAFT_201765 [Aspergillus stella-maris]|uniref:uncharacterized protein n=1 Tax=Aspergillus stella-maris TaxID=1810926 RepID=UPI003CCCEF24